MKTQGPNHSDLNSDSSKEGTQWPRRIKSFVMRAGRTTGGQQKAINELGPKFLIPYKPVLLDWQQAFGHEKDAVYRHRILEIGFGMGETTAYIATKRPEDDFIAIEVHEPGVGALLKRIGEQNISNLRLIRHDAVEVVEHMLDADSLDGIHIYFPDPWHKKKHNKRRLIQPEFVKLLVSKLKPGGYIHLATDWQEYAVQMLGVLTAENAIQNTSKSMEKLEDGRTVPGYADRPDYRPVTKFENRGLKLGHGVWDLVFTKKAS